MKKVSLKNRIATKMILALLVVIMIPTLLISVFFYHAASSIVTQNVRQYSLQIVQQAADSLSNIFNVGSDTSDLVYSDVRIQQLVKNDINVTDADSSATNNSYINNTLNNIIYASSFVKMAYIIRESDTSWGSGIFSQLKLNRYHLSDFSWIQEAKSLDGKLAWAGLQYDRFSGAGENTDLVIPAARVLKDFKTLNNIGYVVIHIDGKTILDKISHIKLGQSGQFFVTNSSGRVMIDKDLTKLDKPVANHDLYSHIVNEKTNEFQYKENGIGYYGVKQTLSNSWVIVGVVPVLEITDQLSKFQKSVFVWSIGFSVLAILIGLIIARKITKPIQKLTNQMKLVEGGDLQTRISINSSDEIGQMSNQFNRMIYKVDQLMEQVKEEQVNKQKAELREIIHRINPHFMFNTLGTIKWLIKFGNTEKAYDGISAFTLLLESYMGKKGFMISIEEELQIIRKYLAILQLRYGRTFDMQVLMDKEAESFQIPRMLLQPLVENAIFHGIVPKDTDGKIDIIIKDMPRFIELRIMDNGLGMDPEQIERLNSMKEVTAMEGTGIGLRHVYECVKLYFPSKSSVYFESVTDVGTMIVLHLHKETEEDQ